MIRQNETCLNGINVAD